MRVYPVEWRHERLLEVMKDYEGNDATVNINLYLGEKDISDRFLSGKLTCGGSETCWKLDAQITERINLEQRNAPVRMTVDIEGIVMTSLKARVTLPVAQTGFVTNLLASTPGALLDKISLREFVEYNSKTPQWVIRDAAYRVGYYDRSQVFIPAFDKPVINLIQEDAFKEDGKPRAILDAIAPEVDCLYYDTQLGGLRTLKDPGIGEGADVEWTYNTNSPEVMEFAGMTWATPDEQFTEVVVRSPLSDPKATNGTGPGGRFQFWYEWGVDYSELEWPPCTGQTMWVTFDTIEDDPDPVGTQLDARQLAFKNADRLSRGLWTGSIKVAFNHLLEPGDVIMIEDDDEDDDGFFHKIWRCVIKSVSWGIEETSLYTTLEVQAILLSNERLPAYVLSLPGVSAGTTSPGVAHLPFGIDAGGLWLDPSKAMNSDGVLWMGVDAGGLWIDPALSEGRAGIDSGGLYLEDGLNIHVPLFDESLYPTEALYPLESLYPLYEGPMYPADDLFLSDALYPFYTGVIYPADSLLVSDSLLPH